MKERTFKLTSAAGGTTASAVDDAPILGKLYAIQWTQGNVATTVDITIATTLGRAAKTLLTITDASASGLYYPRDLVHDAAGSALTGTSGGDRCLPLLDGVLSVSAAQMGNSQTGYITVYYCEDD